MRNVKHNLFVCTDHKPNLSEGNCLCTQKVDTEKRFSLMLSGGTVTLWTWWKWRRNIHAPEAEPEAEPEPGADPLFSKFQVKYGQILELQIINY